MLLKILQVKLTLKEGFALDTRKYKEGHAFLAITGENYNAVKFLKEVLDKKCPLVIFSTSSENSKIINEFKIKYKRYNLYRDYRLYNLFSAANEESSF